MIVVEIDLATARPFIEKWHYSNRCPKGKNIFFGWFIDEELYAVADYGNGVNPYQESSLSKMTGQGVTKNNLLELKRLCRVEPKKDKFPLTMFIAACHKILRSKGYKYIVSFSDPEHGHSGGIYKAANFTHIGKTNAEMHTVDRDGNKRHRRYYYRYAKRKGITMQQARDELGLTRVKSLPKDRWFLVINKKP